MSFKLIKVKAAKFLFLFFGVGLGLFWYFVPGISFSVFIFFLTGFLIRRFTKLEDGNFLLKLFILAVVIRLFLCLGLHLYSLSIGRDGSIFYDDAGIPRLAWRITQYYKGASKSIYDPLGERNFYTNFLSILFYFFGFSYLTAKMFNVLFGALTAIFIYFISKEIFNRKIAKLSAVLVAFFPSLILWSVVNLKDSLVILLISVILWATVKFQKGYQLKYFPFIFFPLIILFDLREFLVLLFVPILIFVFIVTSKIKPVNRLIIIFLIVILFFKLSPVINGYIETKYPGLRFSVDFLLSIHKGFISAGGSLYRIYDEIFYNDPAPPLGLFSPPFLKAFFKGWFYFILVPLPWQISTRLQLLSYPQMIFWIILLPLSAVGILTALRYNWKDSFLIILFIFVTTSAYALSEANVGTAARHRDMLTPFYLIFSSAGVVKLLLRRDVLME